jgi:hypothetical protein
MAQVTTTEELLIKVERLKNMLVTRSTGGQLHYGEFSGLRRELLREQRISSKLPSFLQIWRTEDGQLHSLGAQQGYAAWAGGKSRMCPSPGRLVR